MQLDSSVLQTKRLVELGAGTGIVGLVACHYGVQVTNTDLEDLVPLLQHNIEMNEDSMKGKIEAKPLRWGEDCSALKPPVDYLVLANCIYYESSMEPLLHSMLELSDAKTEVYACYEIRTPEIGNLIERWHALVQNYFNISVLPDDCICDIVYKRDFVKLVKMKRRDHL